MIFEKEKPFKNSGGIVVLRGNLAPTGAILKPSAATEELLQHRGRAIVFEDIDHFKEKVNDPDLDVSPDDVLVLKNCGPKGYPGFPEVGNLELPPKILAQGITDMVRISDARMSGTAYGTVVLHTSPEAAAGGTLALVRDGDMIELDVADEVCTSKSQMKSWNAGAPNGRHQQVQSTGAITSSTQITSCRRIRARISTFSLVIPVRPSRGRATSLLNTGSRFCRSVRSLA